MDDLFAPLEWRCPGIVDFDKRIDGVTDAPRVGEARAPQGRAHQETEPEMIEDRTGRRATLLTSQVPIEHWHECVGDATFGDAIMDRLVHHAHRITLTGGSLRKLGAAPAATTPTDEQH